jgi:outer membrane receptor for monomeric catechols
MPPVQNFAGFFASSGIQNPIVETELGDNPTDVTVVWTGYDPVNQISFGQNCNGWTSDLSTDQGAVGDDRYIDGRWSFTGNFDSCSVPHRLYCLQFP